ncbi:MAG: acetyl-CoA C-acetyltransferase [Desulfobacteraceae bacterium]|jgi:acetyl-CoA C-acetyltransferase|nr:MAG: acetyl-CoA C-acetyltransferase [Desulfobacteraceae bacterium]
MKEAVIAGYLRTAQSRSRPNDPERDWFYSLRADDLLSKLLPELLRRTGVNPSEVEDCITGSAIGVSENWTYGGRLPVFLSNLPETVAAKYVDQQCGSSMAAVHIAAMEVMLGYAEIVLAAGMEHMTRVPMGQASRKEGHANINSRLNSEPQYSHWDLKNAMNMGLTAEKLFSMREFSRPELDQWAKRSHELAARAQEDGFFDGEILPVDAPQADGSKMSVKKDQAIRKDTTLEGLAQLKPVFKQEGAITAGNASPLNAGASAIIIMSKEKARQKGIRPLATIRAIGFAGVDPTIMGIGPVPATQRALKSAGLSVSDIDYWEINEAFTVVALNCIKEMGIDPERVNVMGGGTAIGHALGATGCRILGTLARILNLKKARYGCANACCGGGQGVATIIEREEYDF